MRGYMKKSELAEEALKPGRVAGLLREIIVAMNREGQIKISFSRGTGYDESLVIWETEDES